MTGIVSTSFEYEVAVLNFIGWEQKLKLKTQAVLVEMMSEFHANIKESPVDAVGDSSVCHK